MITPVIMTVLLTMPWLAAHVAHRLGLTARPPGEALACLGLSLVFAFTGVGHFIAPAPMVEMIPPWLPAREASVFASGFFELALAAGFLLPRARRPAGWVTLAFLVAVFPINVWAAWHGVGHRGHRWGPIYLWIRVPLQLLLIGWCWAWAVRRR